MTGEVSQSPSSWDPAQACVSILHFCFGEFKFLAKKLDFSNLRNFTPEQPSEARPRSSTPKMATETKENINYFLIFFLQILLPCFFNEVFSVILNRDDLKDFFEGKWRVRTTADKLTSARLRTLLSQKNSCYTVSFSEFLSCFE